jgi:hypothetical protein
MCQTPILNERSNYSTAPHPTLTLFSPLCSSRKFNRYGSMRGMMTQKLTPLIWILVGVVLLAGCGQQPVLVYVTPTPERVSSDATVVPTAVLATPTPPSATVTDAPTVAPVTPVNAVGALIDSSYTLPPPPPTATSLPPTPAPTQPPAEPTVVPPTAVPPTAAPPVAQGAMPNLDPVRMGIQLDPTLSQDDWNQAIQDIQRLGVKWLKVQVNWKQLQPNSADEISVDFRRLEIYLETAFNAGLDILVSVAKAPNWARSNQNEDGPPDDPQALANFVTLLLNEFGTSVDAVEIWNEPNLSREWQGQPLNGQSYMQYFVPAYQAVTAYVQRMVNDPQTPRTTPLTVITAGLAPTGDNAEIGSRNDRSYLQEMYTAGLGNYRDAVVGVHPYGWGNPPDARCCQMGTERGWDDDPHFFFLDTISDFRDIMVQNGHADGNLWATEFGYATWDGFPGDPPQLWMAYNDKRVQGQYTVTAFQMAQGMDYMGPMMIWNLNFALLAGMVENRDERAAYSLITPLNPRERPAYWMIYDAVRPDVQLEKYD